MGEAALTGDWGCFVCERVVDPADFSGAEAACPYCGRPDGLREMTTDDLDVPEADCSRTSKEGGA